MAFNATLSITSASGKAQTSLKVLEMDFGFSQNIDNTGKPTGRPLINNINMVVESTSDTQIADWMVSFGATKDGKIELELRNNVKKTLVFKKAYCIQYHESFNHQGGESPMHISFTISPEEVELDDSIYISNI
jgi:hypothetical protein